MGCTDMPRIHREVATLMKNLKSQFDGQVKLKESTFDFESEDDCGLDFLISPNDGVYKDCEIEFTMSLRNYPDRGPVVVAVSRIVHPNIDYDVYNPNVCLNVLSEWGTYDDSYRSIDLVIQGVLFLFYEPELDDAVNPAVAFSDMDELQEAVDETKYGGSTYLFDINDWIPFPEFSAIYKGQIPKKATEDDVEVDEVEQPSQENEIDEAELASLSTDSGIKEEETTGVHTDAQEETISTVLTDTKDDKKDVNDIQNLILIAGRYEQSHVSKTTKIVLCVDGKDNSQKSSDKTDNRTGSEVPDSCSRSVIIHRNARLDNTAQNDDIGVVSKVDSLDIYKEQHTKTIRMPLEDLPSNQNFQCLILINLIFRTLLR